MIPDFPELRPLVAQDYPAICEALGHAAPSTCDLNPANLFLWRDSEAVFLTKVGDSLCLLVEPRSGPAYFLEPIGGSHRVDAVRKCLTLVDRLSRVSRKLADSLPPLEFEVRPLRDHFDYVYRTEALVELRGKKFDGKRNHIRKFTQSYPDHEFRPLDRSLFDAALNLFDRWVKRQGAAAVPADAPASLAPQWQRRALVRALDGFELLRLVGGAMLVGGELQGFVIASKDSSSNAFVHFQYANADVTGIYQILLRDACRNLFAGCAWVNLEEDLGVPGLRKTKLSYQPLRLEQKYEVRFPLSRRAAAQKSGTSHPFTYFPEIGVSTSLR